MNAVGGLKVFSSVLSLKQLKLLLKKWNLTVQYTLIIVKHTADEF